MRRAQMNKVMYLGGHPSLPEPVKGAVLVIDQAGIHLRQLRERFVIPWNEVGRFDIEGPEQASRRVTVTRLVAIGVFAFAAKKKGDAESFLYVDAYGGEVGFQIPKPAGEVRAALSQFTAA